MIVDNFKISFNKIGNVTFIDQTVLRIVDDTMWLPNSMMISFVIEDSLFLKEPNYTGITTDMVDKAMSIAGDAAGCRTLNSKDDSTIKNALRLFYKESGLPFDIHSEG